MRYQEITIRKKRITAQDAESFVNNNNRFESKLFLHKPLTKVNGKSLLGVISLSLQEGDQVTIEANGEDEDAAILSAVDFLTISTERSVNK